jgi:hypothetical protein
MLLKKKWPLSAPIRHQAVKTQGNFRKALGLGSAQKQVPAMRRDSNIIEVTPESAIGKAIDNWSLKICQL